MHITSLAAQTTLNRKTLNIKKKTLNIKPIKISIERSPQH